MTSANIGLGDYSEIIATKIGEVTDVIPGEETISATSGVDAGTAAVYKNNLTLHLSQFAATVEPAALNVGEFSKAARSAVEAIRAADAEAEERSRALIANIEREITKDQDRSGASSGGGIVAGSTPNSSGNQELR